MTRKKKQEITETIAPETNEKTELRKGRVVLVSKSAIVVELPNGFNQRFRQDQLNQKIENLKVNDIIEV